MSYLERKSSRRYKKAALMRKATFDRGVPVFFPNIFYDEIVFEAAQHGRSDITNKDAQKAMKNWFNRQIWDSPNSKSLNEASKVAKYFFIPAANGAADANTDSEVEEALRKKEFCVVFGCDIQKCRQWQNEYCEDAVIKEMGTDVFLKERDNDFSNIFTWGHPLERKMQPENRAASIRGTENRVLKMYAHLSKITKRN